MMNNNEMAWARLHDWCISTVNGVVTVRDDMVEGETLTFTDWTELKTWAGY